MKIIFKFLKITFLIGSLPIIIPAIFILGMLGAGFNQVIKKTLK